MKSGDGFSARLSASASQHGFTGSRPVYDAQLICDRMDKIALICRGLHGFQHGRGFRVIVGLAANEDQHAIRCPARDLAGLHSFPAIEPRAWMLLFRSPVCVI